MNGEAWRVAAVALLTGLVIGMPGIGRAAAGEDEPSVTAWPDERPVRPDHLFRVEWVAGPARAAARGFRARCTTTSGAPP